MGKTTMTKSRFAQIFRLQKESGLTVEDFCDNNGYAHSTYYGWKIKFFRGMSSEQIIAYSQEATYAPAMMPITIDGSPAPPAQSTPEEYSKPQTVPPTKMSEISIRLPNGMEINFNGARARESAVAIISNLYNADVLPK